MLFYTILFSLDDPAKNEYVYCCMIWLWSLYKSGSVQKGDKVAILCDPETLKHLQTIHSFKREGVELVEIPKKPRDCREGMAWKYIFRPTIEDVVVYMDVDQIVKKPFRLELPPDSVCAYAEGDISHPNYRGDYPISGGKGFTAGIWAYRAGPKVTRLLDDTLRLCRESNKKFYTLDQPHFNLVLATVKPNLLLMKKEVISFNGNNDLAESAIVNLCGDPGYGSSHLTKMMDMTLLFFK